MNTTLSPMHLSVELRDFPRLPSGSDIQEGVAIKSQDAPPSVISAVVNVPSECPPPSGEAEVQHPLSIPSVPTEHPDLATQVVPRNNEGVCSNPQVSVLAISDTSNLVHPGPNQKKPKKSPGPQGRKNNQSPRNTAETGITGRGSSTNSQNASRRQGTKKKKGNKNKSVEDNFEQVVIETQNISSGCSTSVATTSSTTEPSEVTQRVLIIVPSLDANIESVYSDFLFNLPVGPAYVKGADLLHYLQSNNLSKYELAEQGEYDCESHGIGWCIISSDAKRNINHVFMQCSTQLIHLDGYRYRDAQDAMITIEPKQYRVYQPTFAKYVKQFRGVEMTQSLLNAVIACSVDGLENHIVLQETQQYYLAMMTKRYYAQVNNKEAQVVIQNNGNALWKGSNGYTDFIDTSSELIDHHMPWQIPDTECDLPLDWPLRTDFDVIRCRNVEFSSTDQKTRVDFQTFKNEKLKYPYMHFSSKKQKPRHRTAYFKLSGLNMPDFTEYSNSANNLKHGLKRLFGAKKDEVEQRNEAAKLGAHIATKIALEQFCGRKDIGVRLFNELTQRRRYDEETTAYVRGILSGVGPKDSIAYQVRAFVAEGYEKIYSECTRTRIQKILDSLNTHSHWAYYGIYKACLTHLSPLFSRQQLAEIAHVKRMLRKRYVQGSLLSDQDDLLVRTLNVQVKRELAKFGKAPRCFVSYDAGSVYANELPEFCKVGIDGKHVFQHGDQTLVLNIMAKPKPESLTEIFNDLNLAMSTDNYMFAAIYSDDMVIAGRMGGKSFCFNLDISSNDSSQDSPGFLAAFGCMANFHATRAANLIRQCMLPLTIVSPEDPESYITAQFHGPFEGSGSVLTTLLNHLGSTLIVLTFFRLLCDKVGVVFITDDILTEVAIKGAKMVGHSVTIDNCVEDGLVNFHHVQFLKRSPYHNGREWKPYTNLGCILRALGTVEDDLCENQFSIPSSKFWSLTNDQRISLFCNGIVNGWKHEPTNPIMKALRERFSNDHPTVRSAREVAGTSPESALKHDSLLHIFTEVEDSSQDDNTIAIMARYGCSMEDLNHLARQITRLEVGHEVRSHCFTKIMCVDYGVQV